MRDGAPAGDMVLVVDDNRDELNMLVDALERGGFTALAATRGEAALTLLERVMPSLVVMDAVMPGMDGFTTCQQIKRDTRTAHLPVIFMTGLTETTHVLRGLEVGGTDYVTKPVNLVELLARIRVHIATARAAHGARLALDASGRHLFAINPAGHILWSTPQAASLLSAVFGEGAAPPAPVQALLLRAVAGGSDTETADALAPAAGVGPARYLLPTGPGEYLFQLTTAGPSGEDILRSQLDLTLREVEVLRWLIHGKTNREISEILGISPRTVNKHLERIFSKMGVENRASATSLAMRIMAGKG
ncbi:DNA-binding response regulator [Niveispirillum lacus]|uniref:DNA-binding response regulator n=1 Tax=Niveispirillum lacus TaxID=1981099 RepID=A0A255YYJ3_9PROT|nr:DNA-binding response regulator [Niveispirillum lacus]OYQ34272.1 DNA-binding response regulator [Niveispirillum lacus]